MAKKTRTELSTLAINTNLPDNTTELITPTTERAQLTDERESVVNYKDDLGGVSNAGKFITVATDGESLTMVDEPTGELSGTGSAARIAFWSAAKVLTYDDYLSWNTSTDTLNAFIVNATSKLIAAIIDSPEGNSITLSTQPTGGALTPRLTISDGGNVGIGGTTPLISKFTVSAPDLVDSWNSANPLVTISNLDQSNGQGFALLARGGAGDSSCNIIDVQDYSGNSKFNIKGTGNVGIGTDSPDKALVVNHSADGNLITFEKDEALVGAIGTFSGVPYIGYQVGAGGGIMFNGLNIEPTGLGTARTTGTNNLGTNNYKFKDIYISDGIYFNSNSSNNHLDAYEEGTSTVALTATNSGTITLAGAYADANYTKIGRVVTYSGLIIVTSISSPVGVLNLSLPVAVGTGTDRAFDSKGTILINGTLSENCSDFIMLASEGQSVANIYTGSSQTIGTSSANQILSSSQIWFSITYNV